MNRFFSVMGILCLFAASAWAGGPDHALQQKLQQQLGDLTRVVDTNNKTLADTAQMINQIRTDLQSLQGEIETAKHTVEEQTQKDEKQLHEFDYRITGIEEKFTVYTQQLQELLSKESTGTTTSPAAGMEPAKPESGKPESGKPEAGSQELTEYQQALTEINTQNYKKAIDLFDGFLKKYPKSSLADNAQYWKGEALFALKSYPQAVLEFEKVVKNYPKSPKVAGARLKQGYALYEMKSYQDAKAFLQKLVSQFPKAGESALAQERIAKIDQILATSPATKTKP